jgi:hypothetical protein
MCNALRNAKTDDNFDNSCICLLCIYAHQSEQVSNSGLTATMLKKAGNIGRNDYPQHLHLTSLIYHSPLSMKHDKLQSEDIHDLMNDER